jgi:glucose-induced degradation protein 4
MALLTKIYPSGASTFLRSGTVFQGIQQSGRSTYQVKLKFHYIDLHSSFLCGFLCIQGLSLDNHSLTTYFEAELIGLHYSFQTRRPEWGATERVDLDHWTKFPALKQGRQGKSIKNGWDKAYKKPLDKEYVFMRWKVCPMECEVDHRNCIYTLDSRMIPSHSTIRS